MCSQKRAVDRDIRMTFDTEAGSSPISSMRRNHIDANSRLDLDENGMEGNLHER